MTGTLAREARAGASALQQGLPARPRGRIYLRVAAAASPSHGLCRPPLSGSSAPPPPRPPVRGRRAPPWCADTPPYASRPRPPPAFRSAGRGALHGPYWARAWRAAGRLAALHLWLPGAGSRRRCARFGTHHSGPSPQGWPGPDTGRPLRSRGLGLGPTAAGRARPAASGLVCSSRSCLSSARVRRSRPCSSPLRTYRAAGGCAGVSGMGRLVHLPPRGAGVRAGRRALRRACEEVRPELGRPGFHPAGREAAPFVRVTEPCLRAGSGRGGGGGGGAGLGAIIWEDAVPCSAGAVVPPLKKPAPHCSQAAAAEGRGRPSRRGQE